MLVCERRKRCVCVWRGIDTLAAELLSPTNYLHMTYGDLEDDIPTSEEAIVVLGSGTHRNVSFVKIDWCGVSAVRTWANRGQLLELERASW
ncbi:putative protein ura1 [Phytophthora infestans]|nr:putative protein ura1 [Phytophthora infestans]KAF4148408.1 putative protein ura1 [Phytophthora infestans]